MEQHKFVFIRPLNEMKHFIAALCQLFLSARLVFQHFKNPGSLQQQQQRHHNKNNIDNN